MKMNNILVNIDGGTAVRLQRNGITFVRITGLALLMILATTAISFAQGSIFGSVTNSDATVPANGQVTFIGYLDDKDEELHIEISTGAGYDAGNWFDDFQNYLTEAAGNPYDYYFYNSGNGEGFRLSGFIPNNSFQQENIVLAPVTWPAQPIGMTGRGISTSAVLIEWIAVPSATYHVYRRHGASTGSFFRLDNVTGSLADRGILDTFYVDTTVDGVSSYNYLVIAEDASGNFSPHSAVITVNSAIPIAPSLFSLSPNSGTEFGGTLVTVIGSGFDPAGSNVFLSIQSVPATVISPFLLTFTTPPNTPGSYDITITNISAGLASNTLIGGFVYTASSPPVLSTIGPQSVTENVLLSIPVSALDPDGDIPILSVRNLPVGATFVDSLNGVGLFQWTPGFTDSGLYTVTFLAEDGAAAGVIDSEVVQITVLDAGNQTPVFTLANDTSIFEGDSLDIVLSATDVDGDSLIFSSVGLPLNATLVDNADGTANFIFVPDFTQAAVYPVTFFVSDGLLTDSLLLTVTVNEIGNVPPIFDPIADTSVGEGETLVISVKVTDPDGLGTFPSLSVNTSLSTYTFVDSGNGTATLTYTPNFLDAGVDTVLFFALDKGTPQQTTTEEVVVTTLDVNLAPAFDSTGPFSVLVGSLLSFTVTATDTTDPDPFHRLFLSAINPQPNATFTDNADGTGTYNLAPDASQIGIDTVKFLAVDQGVPSLSTTLDVIISIVSQNEPPVLDSIGPQVVNEGETLNLLITASDPDGGGFPPSLEASNLPENASFTDLGTGSGAFKFSPSFLQSGLFSVTFKASDGIATDKEVVLFQVYEGGNQAPVIDPIAPDSTIEGSVLIVVITAYDPDGASVSISLDPATSPPNLVLVDSGNGTAVITFSPDFTQAGTYLVDVIADDGTKQTKLTVTLIAIEAGNQNPVLTPVDNLTGTELFPISFSVFATDADGDPAILTMVPSSAHIPSSAFVDNSNGSGQFDWTPNDTSAGLYVVQFFAEDGAVSGVFDSFSMTILVADTNRLPLIFTSGSVQIFEGDSLNYSIFAVDPDSTIPFLFARLDGEDSLATNMTMTDNRDGTGTLIYLPGYDVVATSTGSVFLFVRFSAVDEADPSLIVDATSPVQIEIMAKNEPPHLVISTGFGPYAITEGDTLDIIVGAFDNDGALEPTLAAENLPTNSSFSSVQSNGTFTFIPAFNQAGSYTVRFVATDDQGATDTALVQIDVADAGNQAPQWITILVDTIQITSGLTTDILVVSIDPDLDLLTLSASPVDPELPGAILIDAGNGSAIYRYAPPLGTEGTISLITFITSDGLLADIMTTNLLVVAFLRGDVDGNNKYTINDLTVLISFLYRQGPAPKSDQTADVDGNGLTDIADITYMINFLFYNGPSPPQ